MCILSEKMPIQNVYILYSNSMIFLKGKIMERVSRSVAERNCRGRSGQVEHGIFRAVKPSV